MDHSQIPQPSFIRVHETGKASWGILFNLATHFDSLVAHAFTWFIIQVVGWTQFHAQHSDWWQPVTRSSKLPKRFSKAFYELFQISRWEQNRQTFSSLFIFDNISVSLKKFNFAIKSFQSRSLEGNLIVMKENYLTQFPSLAYFWRLWITMKLSICAASDVAIILEGGYNIFSILDTLFTPLAM